MAPAGAGGALLVALVLAWSLHSRAWPARFGPRVPLAPVSNMLREILNNDSFWLLSFRHNLWQVVRWLLGDHEHLVTTTPVWQSAVVLAAWCALLMWIIRRRVRPVEIVA